MHRAFWDAFQEKITEDPPDFSQAVVLIQEVKEVFHCLSESSILKRIELQIKENEILTETKDW